MLLFLAALCLLFAQASLAAKTFSTLLIYDGDPKMANEGAAVFRSNGFNVRVVQVNARNNLDMIRSKVCEELASSKRLVAILDFAQTPEVNTLLHALSQSLQLPYLILASSHQPRVDQAKRFRLQLCPAAILQLLLLRDYLSSEWGANRWKEAVLILPENRADIENFSNMVHDANQYFLIRKWSRNSATNSKMLTEIAGRNIKNFIVALNPAQLVDFFSQVASMRLITIANQFILTHSEAWQTNLSNFAFTGANITAFKVDPGPSRNASISLSALLSHMGSELLRAALLKVKFRARSASWKLKCQGTRMPQGRKVMRALLSLAASNYSLVKSPYIRTNIVDFRFQVLQLLTSGYQRRSYWRNGRSFHNSVSRTKVTENLELLMQNVTLRVVTIEDPPFVIRVPQDAFGNEQVGNKRWTGLTIELLEQLSSIRRFSYTLYEVPDQKFGSLNDSNGRWDGLIGQLIDNKADMVAASLTITYDRERVIDFTTPYMSLGLSIIIMKPKSEAGLFQFMAPMSNSVWSLMFLAYVIVSLTLFFLARLSPSEWYKQYPCSGGKINQFSITNSFWFTFESMLHQGGDLNPRATSTRIIGAAWWFFVLIMVASYTANLAAFLTIDRLEGDITNVEELSRQSVVNYGSLQGGSTYSFFKNSEISTYKRMWRHMSSMPSLSFVKNTKEGIDRVATGKYAFILESTLNEYYRERNCDLMPLGGLIDSRGYGIGLPSGSLLRDPLTEDILKLKKEQWLEKQRVKWLQHFNVSKPCSQKSGSSHPQRQRSRLNEQSVGGVFVCLLLGIFLSVTACTVETFVRACKAKRKGQVSSFCSFVNSQCQFACCACCEREDPELPPEVPPSPLLCSCRPHDDFPLSAVLDHHGGGPYAPFHPGQRSPPLLLEPLSSRPPPDGRNGGVWEPRREEPKDFFRDDFGGLPVRPARSVPRSLPTCVRVRTSEPRYPL